MAGYSRRVPRPVAEPDTRSPPMPTGRSLRVPARHVGIPTTSPELDQDGEAHVRIPISLVGGNDPQSGSSCRFSTSNHEPPHDFYKPNKVGRKDQMNKRTAAHVHQDGPPPTIQPEDRWEAENTTIPYEDRSGSSCAERHQGRSLDVLPFSLTMSHKGHTTTEKFMITRHEMKVAWYDSRRRVELFQNGFNDASSKNLGTIRSPPTSGTRSATHDRPQQAGTDPRVEEPRAQDDLDNFVQIGKLVRFGDP